MKSIKKEVIRPLQSTLLLLLLAAGIGCPVVGQGPQDVLDFYWKRAGAIAAAKDPGRAGLHYRLSTRNFYKKLSRGGRETLADSATIDFFYTGATLDSQVVREGSGRRFDALLLSIPDLFAYPYQLSGYPNDDGRGGLAIGLGTDSADVTQPTGLLLIDRETYEMQSLYLYYEEFEDYVRFTRSFGFAGREGYVVPDTAWIVASRPGILSPEHFRIETDITDFHIYK